MKSHQTLLKAIHIGVGLETRLVELLSDSIPKRSKVIGASVSKPLSSDLNVNFVCLSVCLSWTVNLP